MTCREGIRGAKANFDLELKAFHGDVQYNYSTASYAYSNDCKRKTTEVQVNQSLHFTILELALVVRTPNLQSINVAFSVTVRRSSKPRDSHLA